MTADRPRRAGAALAALWNAVALLALNAAAVRLGWWSFGTAAHPVTGSVWAGVPVDVIVGWAVLWGAVPVLLGAVVRSAVIATVLVAADLVAMASLAPLVVLGPRWLWGEALAVAVSSSSGGPSPEGVSGALISVGAVPSRYSSSIPSPSSGEASRPVTGSIRTVTMPGGRGKSTAGRQAARGRFGPVRWRVRIVRSLTTGTHGHRSPAAAERGRRLPGIRGVRDGRRTRFPDKSQKAVLQRHPTA